MQKQKLLEDFLKYAQTHDEITQLFTKDNTEKLPIHHAMELGNLAITKLLIDYGALDEFIYSDAFFDKDKRTPFDLACVKGCQQFILEIIRYTAETVCKKVPNIADRLLFWAAIREYYDIFAYLVLERKANVSLFDARGNSFLHRAAIKGRLGAVKFLCEHGVKIDHQNNEGRTALHEAAAAGKEEVVSYLVDRNCGVRFWDKQGHTALQLAEEKRSFNRGEETRPYKHIVDKIESAECKVQ